MNSADFSAGPPHASRPAGGPRDVFLNLAAIGTLYISAASFGALLFHFIDLLVPDALAGPFVRPSGAIRWAIAALVVMFPVYVAVSRRLALDVATDPAKRELRVRRWLWQFTLFAAAAVMLGDLVALLYNFLGGDLTARFVFKVLSVFLIAAAVFAYYRWNLRHAAPVTSDATMRLFAGAVVAAVVVSVIAGFVVVGSPFRERDRKFDERRIGDLQSLQSQIVFHWQRKNALPATLDQLRDDISGFAPGRDPESGASYEYRRATDLSFELCATFKTASSETAIPQAQPVDVSTFGNWNHDAGRVCFRRTIDPELYRAEPAAPLTKPGVRQGF